jgi:hypothetical protein
MKNKIYLIVASMLLLAALACANDATQQVIATSAPKSATAAPTEAAPKPTRAPAKVGDKVQSGDTALTVIGAKKLTTLPVFGAAKAGNVYVNLEVLIENVGSTEVAYNPLYFKLKDGDDFEYNATISSSEPTLKSGKLAPSEKARGNVAFEVKATATGLVMEYRPLVFGGDTPIKVALGEVK